MIIKNKTGYEINYPRTDNISDFVQDYDNDMLFIFIGNNKQLLRGSQNAGIFFLNDTVLKIAGPNKSHFNKPNEVLKKYPKRYIEDQSFTLDERIFSDLSDYFIEHYPRKLLEKYEEKFTKQEYEIIKNFHNQYVKFISFNPYNPLFKKEDIENKPEIIIDDKVVIPILIKFVKIIKKDILTFIFNISRMFISHQKDLIKVGYLNIDEKWDNLAIALDEDGNYSLKFLDMDSGLYKLDSSKTPDVELKKSYKQFKDMHMFDYLQFNPYQERYEQYDNKINLYFFKYFTHNDTQTQKNFKGFEISNVWPDIQ